MTLLINNADVQQVLTMEATIGALSEAYGDGARGEAVCRPRPSAENMPIAPRLESHRSSPYPTE